MDSEFFAITGGVMGALSNLPQILKIKDTDNVESFCPRATVLQAFGAIFFIVYAFQKRLPVIFFGALGSLLFNVYILLKIKKSQRVL
jgi:uncharacterized protein with PQ loop repeat